eukprot:CAMPEP_0185010480 /NCGR_PEP_ID=MMETSP1098-20130426/95024_1 /TAXON_ID=89044 /ORGANISM="Spumella elongata, Strain CCAP 955/1" /LENGTH=76 /DNA_ID=CAMNT_0027539361 /DNA_START=268 /DNA_END=498 /DNA_ORIENTATION=-
MRLVRGVKGSEIAGGEQLKTHSRIHGMHNQNQKEFCGMQRGGQPVNIVVRGAQQQLHDDMHESFLCAKHSDVHTRA